MQSEETKSNQKLKCCLTSLPLNIHAYLSEKFDPISTETFYHLMCAHSERINVPLCGIYTQTRMVDYNHVGIVILWMNIGCIVIHSCAQYVTLPK